ncbi:MAG: Fic family protein [Clostridia bacterium]|nr:Fic family protein [Clostridia bacterium]
MRTFDYEKLKTQKWDNEIVFLLAKIRERKGREGFVLSQKPALLRRLETIAKTDSIIASNALEGIFVSPFRLKRLCGGKALPKTPAEGQIYGYGRVLNEIQDRYGEIPIKVSYLLGLHRELFAGCDGACGGQLKNRQNYISEARTDGRAFVRFMPLSPYETPEAMFSLCASFQRALDGGEIDPLLLVPVFVNDFLCIYPFDRGNNELSRLLTVLLLLKIGCSAVRYISLDKKIEATKEEYYEALNESMKGWHENAEDASPLIKYLLKTVLSAYEELEEKISSSREKLPALEIVRKAAMSMRGRFTKTELLGLCHSLGKASVENALKKLLEDGYILRYGSGKNTYYTKR